MTVNLQQQLQQSAFNGTALRGEPSYSFATLLSDAQALRQQYPQLAGQNIALTYQTLPQFIIALLAFDGWCHSVYLQPAQPLLIPDTVQSFPANVLSCSVIKEHSTEATCWYLATSGTTGTPKWIGHSMVSLTRAVKNTTTSRTLHWGLCYQPYRFAGLQVVLQSLLSGACLTDCTQGDINHKLQQMQHHGVSAISATPSLWRQLLMTGQLHKLKLQQLTLGGEIADQPLLSQLDQLFPTARLLHIYASTEAGVGFAVADKQAGFPAHWLHEGTNGIRFRISENHHLWLQSTHIPKNIASHRIDSSGFIDTEDQVTIKNDRVHFMGRASGVINVGGNKVHPEQVEQILLQVPGVQQAYVYAKTSSVLGQLVVADLVAVAGEDTTNLQKAVLAYCLQHLQRFQIPTRLNWLNSLAVSDNGKLSRRVSDA